MSVPLSKRSLSKYQYYENAVKMRISITNLLLRDFGIKDKVRDFKFLTKFDGVSNEDIDILNKIAEKYKLKNVLHDQYPEWLIDYFRENILDILKNLIFNITAAHTVNEKSKNDCLLKRGYQISSIINCEQLLQEFQYIADVLPCNFSKILPYVDMIDYEIKLLKMWKSSIEKSLKNFD